MSAEKTNLCDEYKLYFKIDDDVEILKNELEIYNTSFVGNDVLCHTEYIDGKNTLAYSIPAMITMDQFVQKKIHKDELLDILYSIADQLMYLKANDLDMGRVLLSTGYMYVDLSDMSVQLIYLPVDREMDKCDMDAFVRNLISRLSFADKQASDCGYEIIKYFDHNVLFFLSEYFKFISDLKNNTATASKADEDTTASSNPSSPEPISHVTQQGGGFKLAKEKKDYSSTDIGFEDLDDSDESTTVLTNSHRTRNVPVIIRSRTGEKIKIEKPIFCIGKSNQGVDYQVTDNNSVSRRHAYIINVNGVYYLRDNKSTNHTYLGGKIINSGTDVMLIDGSKFKLANEEFVFKEK